MSSKGTPDPNGETYIMPGANTGRSAAGIGTRPTDRNSATAETKIVGGVGTGRDSPASRPNDKFVDPFATVLMTEAGGATVGLGSETQVIRPDAAIGKPTQINPVVAVLVVTGGPGKGAYRPLYYGNNTIGRDASQKVCLNFGDDAISSHEQCYIRYDHEARSFLFIPNNAKTNVVSVNTEKPTNAVTLQPWDEIRMGQTHLRFLPICGQWFDWSDVVDQ